jgi:UDP-glucose:(heptosyl)LPS alpha-1,3-glucosyltransferase
MAAIAKEHFDLVQSYERLPHCDIYHAVDGVHAEWLRQRNRISGTAKKLGVAINPRHRFVLNAERAMYSSPRFKAAICISEMVKQDILRHFDVSPEKLHVVYSGIDAAKYSPGERDPLRAATRANLTIPNTAPVAVFVGSGFERKGLRAFLEALALDGKTSSDQAYGIVVGKDKQLAKYQALAKQLGISERVRFTGGVPDATPYYAASDVFVLPTLYEPFGLVYLEAMASGLPVVASHASGAAELVQEGVNGCVTDALDTSAIARAMKACMSQSAAMGMAARQTALTFTPQNMSQQYAAIYRGLRQ